MKDLVVLLKSPAFVPLSIGVGCNEENLITVTHTAEDIEKSLGDLLEKARHLRIYIRQCRIRNLSKTIYFFIDYSQRTFWRCGYSCKMQPKPHHPDGCTTYIPRMYNTFFIQVPPRDGTLPRAVR